jgi:hypothetical protein
MIIFTIAKRDWLFLFIFITCTIPVFSQVGIGTKTPDSSAILELSSANKGFLPPRTDTSSITNPAKGLLIYDTNTLSEGYYYYNGVQWQAIGAGELPFNGNRTVTRSGVAQINAGGTTITEFLNNYFFPSEPPSCNINGTGSTTIEYKSTSSAAIQINLSFSVNRQASTENIATALVNCNQSISGFPYDFFSPPGSNNQSGSLNNVSLADNVTNTFTVSGTTVDGKSCSSSRTYSFRFQRYWGNFASAVPPTNPAFTISDAQILALNGAGVGSGSEFATSRTRAYNGINGDGKYLAFAFPSTWGTPVFKVNGLTNTAFTRVRNDAFVNASGYSETYQVWISNDVYNSPVSQFEIQ